MLVRDRLFEYGFNFFVRNVLKSRSSDIEKFILDSYNKVKNLNMCLEKIIFSNLFFHEINNKIILIFRTTNIFDLSGHVWRNNIFQKYLTNNELSFIVERLTSRTDRFILKQAIKNKNIILEFINKNIGNFNVINKITTEISSTNIEDLLRYVPNINMTYIDIIKDIRNILVHGFNVKNIYFYSPLEKNFEKYFFRIVENEKINKLFDMMFLLNLAIFTVIIHGQDHNNFANIGRK